MGLLTPKANLDPPHYDGIQSLCLMGDLLFSGSRDTCIKKWNLAEQQLKYVCTGRTNIKHTLSIIMTYKRKIICLVYQQLP